MENFLSSAPASHRHRFNSCRRTLELMIFLNCSRLEFRRVNNLLNEFVDGSLTDSDTHKLSSTHKLSVLRKVCCINIFDDLV